MANNWQVHGKRSILILWDATGASRNASGDMNSITFTWTRDNTDSTTFGQDSVQRVPGILDAKLAGAAIFSGQDTTGIDAVPSGVAGWVVKPVEISDVPILNLTLYSATASDADLRRVGDCGRRVWQARKQLALFAAGVFRQLELVLPAGTFRAVPGCRGALSVAGPLAGVSV